MSDDQSTPSRVTVAGITHDLNNILAAIDAVAEDALARSASDVVLVADLAEIRRHVERGAALVATLLGEARRLAPPPPLRLAAALAEFAPLLRRLAGAGVTLAMPPGNAELAARIDPVAFQRVVANLVANARDAMPGGGTATLLLVGMPDAAVIEVIDTGTGIAPDLLTSVFEPFVTTKPAKTGLRTGGAGLGLAAVRDLVHAAGGEVAAENMPGGGARFTVRLPLAAASPNRPCRVLLVEDEDSIRHAFVRRFVQAGWHVLTAASAGAARALFDAPGEAPDLLICDFSLPDGDGLALVREVRRIHRALRVILVSGYADTAMREACVELGIRFLAKPVPASILLQAATDSMPVVATGENI